MVTRHAHHHGHHQGEVNIVDATHVAQYTVDPTGSGGVLFKPLWEEAFDPLTDPPA